jgi:hypothetical protein
MKLLPVLLAGGCSVLLCPACTRSNNLLLGRVEAPVGGHTVVVTDCYRTSVPRPEHLSGPAGSAGTYHFVPCRDADVTISAGKLVVNGQSYGMLTDGDTVVVDHGKVLVNDREARVVAASR